MFLSVLVGNSFTVYTAVCKKTLAFYKYHIVQCTRAEDTRTKEKKNEFYDYRLR